MSKSSLSQRGFDGPFWPLLRVEETHPLYQDKFKQLLFTFKIKEWMFDENQPLSTSTLMTLVDIVPCLHVAALDNFEHKTNSVEMGASFLRNEHLQKDNKRLEEVYVLSQVDSDYQNIAVVSCKVYSKDQELINIASGRHVIAYFEQGSWKEAF